MSEDKSKFTKKVSPLIEGQVPDFVQADHPVFVDFVKDLNFEDISPHLAFELKVSLLQNWAILRNPFKLKTIIYKSKVLL